MEIKPQRCASINDITGDSIKSRTSNQDLYAENWERIFGKKEVVVEANSDEASQDEE